MLSKLIRRGVDSMTCENWPGLMEEKNIPCYVQIYDIIFQMIQKGELREGDSLPGENLLAAHWNVSRSTVRMAVRKLEEDGYLYKMQGKRTTVASITSQFDHGLQWLSNPCIGNCVAPITKIKVSTSLQQSGGYVAKQLGYPNASFVMGIVDAAYFAEHVQVGSSVCIFHASMLERWNLSLADQAAMEELVTRGLYQKAKRSRITLNAMYGEDERGEVPGSQVIVVLEEVLFGENDEAIAYCKYRVNGSWYRFSVDRKGI